MQTRHKVIILILALGVVVYDLVTHLVINWHSMVDLIKTQRPSDEIIELMKVGLKLAGLLTLIVSAAFICLFSWSMAQFALWQAHRQRYKKTLKYKIDGDVA